MAINSVLQTIRNAEIDARSLSEFVSKGAYFTVTRRLAPTIHTLDYYLLVLNKVKDKGDLADIAISDTLNKLDQLEPTVIQRVEDAINNTAIEGGVLADTFVVVDGSLSQRTINKGLESIADLSTINNPKDGLRVYVKSYHAGFGKGGGYFTYDSSKSDINDGGVVINGWVRDISEYKLSFEDFGAKGDGTTDDTTTVQKALNHTITKVTGRTGAIYKVSNLILQGSKDIEGHFTFLKGDITKEIIKITCGAFDAIFNGITFDGSYDKSLGDEYYDTSAVAPDISFIGTDEGLTLLFKHCKHNNIIRNGLYTGFTKRGINKIESISCSSNGLNRHRVQNDSAGIFSVHHAYFVIQDYYEKSDGVMSQTPTGTILDMPMPVVYATYTKLIAIRPKMIGTGGISLYSGCDNSCIIDAYMDNCAYPFRAQAARNVRVVGGVFKNSPFSIGAVHYAPYARQFHIASRVEEDLSGLTVENVTFINNERDIVVQGNWQYNAEHYSKHVNPSGPSYQDQEPLNNTKARNINVICCSFKGVKENNISLQDASLYLRNNFISMSDTQKQVISVTQTEKDGLGHVQALENYVDGTLNPSEAVFIFGKNNIYGINKESSLYMEKNTFLNMNTEGSQYLFSLNGVEHLTLVENYFKGVLPSRLIILRDHETVTIQNNSGLQYPLTGDNSLVNLVNIEVGVDEVTGQKIYKKGSNSFISDHSKTSSSIPQKSEFYVENNSTEEYLKRFFTNFAEGSIATFTSPLTTSDGVYLGRIKTDSGWPLFNKLPDVEDATAE